MNRLLKSTALLLAVLFMTACSQQQVIQSMFSDELADAQATLELFIQHDEQAIEPLLIKQLKTVENRKNLSKVLQFFPKEQVVSIEALDAKKIMTAGFHSFIVQFQLQYPENKWFVARVTTTEISEGVTKLSGINIHPSKGDLKELNAVTFADKGLLHWVVLLLCIVTPIFIIVTFIVCLKTPIKKRKWLWATFILFGVTRLLFDWELSEWSWSLASFQLLGVGYTSNLVTNPLILQWAFPLGAVIFWFKRKTLIQASSELNGISAINEQKQEKNNMNYPTIEQFVGNTPLVRLQRLVPTERNNIVLVKLEGNNPAGSVKDRPAISMISRAEARGDIKPGDVLIEATSGNTGIALAMAAAIKGYKMILIMPDNASEERVATMKAFGADVVPVTQEAGMEGARDLALEMQADGKGKVLNQFANYDNPEAHYTGTGPEIWRDTGGNVTHFVSAMGTTGTIMGTSRFLKEQNADIQIVGVQPDGESSIPGIRRWPEEYLPEIFERPRVDKILDMDQQTAEVMTRRLAAEEGIFAGVSSGGAVAAALRLEQEVENAVIVTVICDRGDRYLSTGVFPA